MFVALRDLRHARGRFALMLLVITLITFLVTFLSSLTAGLARESTSAITDLPSTYLSFSMPETDAAPEFTASSVTRQQWEAWGEAPDVSNAEPLGVATTRARSAAQTVAVTAFGVLPSSALLGDASAPSDGAVVLSSVAAEALAADPGDTVAIAGQDLLVTAVLESDASFAHTPAIWVTLTDWQAIGAPSNTGGDDLTATAIAITSKGLSAAERSTLDADLGTTTLTTAQARTAISSFSSENSSLLTMQAFLIAISALVVGAFFTVWTISRSGDVAVLKALGASTRYLLRDAIGQAALVLVLGVGLGVGLAVAAATALASVVPVEVTNATTALPALALIALGLAGAALAITRIARIDPHAALAAH